MDTLTAEFLATDVLDCTEDDPGCLAKAGFHSLVEKSKGIALPSYYECFVSDSCQDNKLLDSNFSDKILSYFQGGSYPPQPTANVARQLLDQVGYDAVNHLFRIFPGSNAAPMLNPMASDEALIQLVSELDAITKVIRDRHTGFAEVTPEHVYAFEYGGHGRDSLIAWDRARLKLLAPTPAVAEKPKVEAMWLAESSPGESYKTLTDDEHMEAYHAFNTESSNRIYIKHDADSILRLVKAGLGQMVAKAEIDFGLTEIAACGDFVILSMSLIEDDRAYVRVAKRNRKRKARKN